MAKDADQESRKTVAELIAACSENLTRAERQLANSILESYPVSGLGTITTVATTAGVSTPTVVRLLRKLGISGFAEFQAELRHELEAKISDPIARHDRWVGDAPTEHILNRFTAVVLDNIRHSLARIDPAEFDRTCALLADTKRSVYVAGGRITRTLADYLYLHLQVIRPGVVQVQSMSNAWPHYLLDMAEGDLFVIFDVRRYENTTLRLAELAAERGGKIILFTDQWRSPISKLADTCFSSRIAVPSSWDSSVVTLVLMEAVIAEIQERLWSDTRRRMESLETLLDRTRLFRKFT